LFLYESNHDLIGYNFLMQNLNTDNGAPPSSNETEEPKNFRQLLPYLALVVTVLATSMGGLFVRWANAPGPVTVFYRTGLATFLVAPFLVKDVLSQKPPLKEMIRWLPIAMLGGLLISLDQAAWASALLLTKMANTTFFNSMAPLWVALFALIAFKEKRQWKFWLGLLISMGGTLLILGLDCISRSNLGSGDFLGLLSSFFYGGYFIVTQVGRRHLNTIVYTWVATLSCTVCLFVLNTMSGNPLTGYSWSSYLAFLGAALTSQVIGYFSMGYALGHLPASLVSPTMLAKPVIVAILAFSFFGENLTPVELLGGGLVLAGIYLVNRNELKLKR
jgi:drug/metabolite transporter (DMT)-like permease